MKKLNLLAIMILIVTIGTITKVKAKEYVPHYISTSELSSNVININTTNDMYEHVMNLNSNQLISWGNYTMLKGTYAYINQTETITTNTNININNISWTETASSLQCTHISSSAGNESNVGTIHYMDGTTATIDWKTRTYICDLYAYSQGHGDGYATGTSVSYKPNIDNNPYIIIYTRYNNSINGICKVDYNGWFECEKTGSTNNINNFVFNITKRTANIDNAKVMLFRMIYFYNSDTQAIINNQNQNAQQQHQDNQNINNSIQDTNNTLNDSTIDNNNTSSSTSEWNNKVASNGTITNLLTLPIQLMQGYVNGMNSTCTPFNLGNLFGTNIILPCINVGDLIGSSLWSVIDVLFSGFMIFGIAKKLIKIFNDFTNMKSNQVDELYGGGA